MEFTTKSSLALALFDAGKFAIQDSSASHGDSR